MLSKDKTALLLAEFFGTFVLTSVVLGMMTKLGLSFFVGLTAGITLGLMVLVIGKISGSHINPAVTLGLWSIRKIETNRAIVYVAAQMFGAVCAWRLAVYFYQQQLTPIAKSGLDWRVFVAEMVGTFLLTFAITATISQGMDQGKQAAAIGISLFVGIVIASMASNGVLNPAVALGIRSFNVSYAVGPIVGGILGANAYEYLFSQKPTKKKPVAKK